MSVCTNIVLTQDQTNGDLLEVVIDNSVYALWYYPYADALEFVGKEVIVDYRKDIYNGKLTQFIKTFTVPTIVHTLDKKENIKLYVEQEDNNSNLSFNEIAIGENRQGCIYYCCKQEFKSSPSAVWMELLIRDKLMRVAKLRIFDPQHKDAELAGHYLCSTLSRSKFGFQTEETVISHKADLVNPEIEIAQQFITNFFSADTAAMQYITKLNMFEHMKKFVDYEPGYALVRMAMELAMCESLTNITNDTDVTVVSHVILASFGYTCRDASILSPCVNNVFLAQQFHFPDKQKVICCLDECLEEHPEEYPIVTHIKSCVDTILRLRKGFE